MPPDLLLLLDKWSPEWNNCTYQVSKLVHLESESEGVRVLIVSINVLLVGLPDDVPTELLFIASIRLAVLLRSREEGGEKGRKKGGGGRHERGERKEWEGEGKGKRGVIIH